MGCKGRILDVAMMARARLTKETGCRIIRYMNAAHVAAFVGLSDTYTSSNLFAPLNKEKNFLTEQETQRIVEIGPDSGSSAAFELLAWAMMEVELALKDEQIDPRHASQFRDNVLEMRASIGAIYDFKDQPIPFFYIHFLCLLTAFYLPLYSLNSALDLGSESDAHWAKDLLSCLVVLLQAIFIVGLRVLGQKLSDPFGTDLVDLSVMHYCAFTWKLSNRLLLSHAPSGDYKSFIEWQLMNRNKKAIGEAWIDSTELSTYEPSHATVGSIPSQVDQNEEKSHTVVSAIMESWNDSYEN
eukprot:CAMPEP_0172483272 /NCGR_PEP_ID=MMETSP1066-20121228/10188_1 /TAXON_ID=671091 /ORGANISM="Coscinodiscus wailesii, Strain CCMP2513" /LENGTH=297 /DNA_ID=CAMNT_0013247031 /DNA_START=382 /DNA_END=1275 /DNA_ORIENTATION=-